MSMQRKDRKKLFIYLAAFAAVAGAAFIYKYFFDGNTDGFVRSATPTSATEVAQIQESKILPTTSISQSLGSEKTSIDVYICGQVRSPGVYTFVPGVILDDVISKAGGFTPDAAKDRVNLVYVITSNISVYIPTEEECESGFTDDLGIIRASGANTWKNSSQSPQTSGIININTASAQDLMTLPGIGEVLAAQIISYRDEHPFKSCDEICKVSGIGEAKYNKIKDQITCE